MDTNADLGYGRVSTEEQARDSNAAAQQYYRLVKAGCTEIFFDHQSGSEDDRPEFEKILHRIRSRTCRSVTITRDDRITRRGAMTLELLDLFAMSGIQLRILDGGGVSDLKNPYEWKQRAQAGIDAEFEVRMLSMRIKEGFEYLREQGKANHKMPFGYLRVDEHYQIDSSQWKETKLLVSQVARGSIDSFLQFKTLLGSCRFCDEQFSKVWTPNGLRRWLLNPVLRGHTPYLMHGTGIHRYSKILYNTHEALMTEAEFSEIEAIFNENKRLWGANREAKRYPLSGQCQCSRCGKMLHISHGNDRIYFYCPERRNRSQLNACENGKTARLDRVEVIVIQALIQKADSIAQLAETPPSTIESPEILALRAELTFYQAAPGHRAAGIVEDLKRSIDQCYKSQQHQVIEQSTKRELLLQYFSNPIYWEHGLTDEEKRDVYRALVDRVVIRDGAVVEVKLKV